MGAAIKLRSRKPYTCRRPVGATVCAAYLSDADGDLCPACAALKPGELKPVQRAHDPVSEIDAAHEAALWDERRRRGPIWPTGELEPGERPWQGVA